MRVAPACQGSSTPFVVPGALAAAFALAAAVPAIAQRAEEPAVKAGDAWSFAVYYSVPTSEPRRHWAITSVTPAMITGTENGEPLTLTLGAGAGRHYHMSLPRKRAMDEAADLRQQLKNAIKSRAMVYLAFYDELAAEVSAAKAEEILKRAIYKRGCAVGGQFKRFAPGDFDGLRDAFIDFVPDHGGLFQPDVRRCDAGGLDIKFHACPLKEAWQEAGVSDAKLETMCRVAGIVDNGTFESAGFVFAGTTWKPGEDGCCHLRVRPGPA